MPDFAELLRGEADKQDILGIEAQRF